MTCASEPQRSKRDRNANGRVLAASVEPVKRNRADDSSHPNHKQVSLQHYMDVNRVLVNELYLWNKNRLLNVQDGRHLSLQMTT